MPHGKSGCNLAGLYCLPWLFYYGGMSRTYGPRPWKVDLPLHECMGLQVEQTIRDSLTKMTWNRSKLCLVRIAFPFFPGYKTLRRVVPLSIAGARPPTSLKRLVNWVVFVSSSFLRFSFAVLLRSKKQIIFLHSLLVRASPQAWRQSNSCWHLPTAFADTICRSRDIQT